ncbi:MAG: radical SAM protein [Bacteroidales bacterium]|nr:radical SAM protein [Bacteroidales bacterium]
MVYDVYNFLKKLKFGKIANYLKIKLSYTISLLIRKPVIWGGPAFATVEPVNMCNLKCPECPVGNQSLSREKGYIHIELFRQIIDSLSQNLMWLMLYFEGEPFLHKSLTKLIRYASSKKIYTVVSTNGHYLTEANARKVIDSGLDRIIISLDGTDQESYEIYRKGGDFNKVVDGIKTLTRLRRQKHAKKPFIIIQCLLMKHTENQIDRIKNLGKELGVDRVVFKTLQVTDFEKNNFLLPGNLKVSRYKISEGKYSLRKKIPNRCRRIWDTIVILHNGITVPCCFDKDASFEIGKFPQQKLSEIWKGKVFNRFRKKVLTARKTIDMCCNCTG